MVGIVDNAQASLTEQMEQIETDIHRISNKLNNDGFMSKAPAAFVEKERDKLTALKKQQAKVKAQLNAAEQ
jgi:valyl-tRNA synthetase